MFPKSISSVIESFKLLPGIGEKTAERLAFYVLDMENDQVDNFSRSLLDMKEKIHRCPVCNNYTEEEKCIICNDQTRNGKVLCVVEDPKSIYLFEKSGIYHGYYHTINGLISPLDGINPEDIGIEKLISRIKDANFEEIIIAVRPSIEGETTSLYIKKILEDMNIKITKLASGLPIGADMDYIDSMTLERALVDRKTIE